ncbi:hemagglutinin repeat-containing protein [Acetobacteraceae bacterium ESL0709]|nr:hemagglutinin repeat-containing protein [Acetobacteraceae bacterium ESL0709]
MFQKRKRAITSCFITFLAMLSFCIVGAEASGKQITVTTGNLEITSPQDSSSYKSHANQGGAGFQLGLNPLAGSGGGGSYQGQKITDNFKTTGEKLSGLYAGDDGLKVTVGDTTHLKAGVIASTADAAKNSLTTGKLIAESEENLSQWKATSKGGGLSLGTGMLGSTTGMLGAIGTNLAANSGLITGVNVSITKRASASPRSAAISRSMPAAHRVPTPLT